MATNPGVSKKSQSRYKPKILMNDIFTKIQDPPFEKYISNDQVSKGLMSGHLFQGVVRINAYDYREAYITDELWDGPDYFINGLIDRNRSLEGDVVAFELLNTDQYEPYRKDREDISTTTTGIDDGTETVTTILEPDNKSLYALKDDQSLKSTQIDSSYGSIKEGMASDNSHSSTDTSGLKLQVGKKTIKIVQIIREGHKRVCVGSIKVYNKKLQKALVSPSDNRIPRIVVKLTDLPSDFCKNHIKYENTLFACRLCEWAENSPFPNGEIICVVGEAGEIEPETMRILIEQDIDYEEFSSALLQCLPSCDSWTIPHEEIVNRRDFRSECVLTIDPSTARDLDDALHLKLISPSIYEVGVHIADVSYFLLPDSPLDKIASQRATSIYLVQRVIPMLPRPLCEYLCSLIPNKDRLTFSVVWTLSDKGELLGEWIGRSIIRSKAKLSYDEAQQIIDYPKFHWQKSHFPTIADEQHVPVVVQSVITLNQIANTLRQLRQSNGCLKLDRPKLSFTIDEATGLPNGYYVHKPQESNRLIEEYMLLANMAVANFLAKTYPDKALLRRHPSPKRKLILDLKNHLKVFGVDLNFASAGDLQNSLNAYKSSTSSNYEFYEMEKTVITNMCCTIMELATYFCSGSVSDDRLFHHYALNIQKYTHFTSPIRRYADVIVHRLLALAIHDRPSKINMTTEKIQEQAEICNKKNKASKVAQELNSELFLGVFIRDCGPLIKDGMVVSILDKSFDVLLEIGIVKRIYCDRLRLSHFKFHQETDGKAHLLLSWKHSKTTQDLYMFCPVKVTLISIRESLQFEVLLNNH